MVLTRRPAHILINKFHNLSINQQVQMAAPVNYVLSSFEGGLNPGDPQGVKLHRQATKEIDKEADKFNISVSNALDIIYHFPSLANKYDLGRHAFMVDTGADEKSIFRQVEQIQIADMHHQEHG